MAKVSPSVVDLSCDPYGNYAMTEIISKWPQSVCAPIYKGLKTNLAELCIQKYSSNVLDRCFDFAPLAVRSDFI